ncbi:nicotinate-nucleotide--dimethylbenzimidazole phosphoribosyltransferase [Streptomyces sp. NPDC090106]|uniref:nicotinate-nucleotide--dimethylbenzimidazole phosphoribosyltransferase n=1 Tax=Streptomyces sp. NPDC090106 TaxID=3365946 RepID=UPI00382AA7F8
MTDTGQIPGEGLPESAGMVEQPGVPAAHGAYTYLSETTVEDEDLLLPGAQGAWGNEVAPPAPEPVVETMHAQYAEPVQDPYAESAAYAEQAHEPGPHETAGRDSGSVDLGGVRLPDPAPAPVAAPSLPIPPITPRRPLHLGPPTPDASASPVRSLADRGPAGMPVRQMGPPTTGPEYLDVPQPLREMAPQGAAPWGAPAPMAAPAPAPAPVPAPAAETVVPGAEPVDPAQAAVARLTSEAGYGEQGEEPVAVPVPVAEATQEPGPVEEPAPAVVEAPAPEAVQIPDASPVDVPAGVPGGPDAGQPAPFPEAAPEPVAAEIPEVQQVAEPGPVQAPGAFQEPVEVQEPGQVVEPGSVAEPGQVAEPVQAVEPTQAVEPEQGPEAVEVPEAVQLPEAMQVPEAAQIPEAVQVPEPAQFPEPAEIPEPVQAVDPVQAPEPAQQLDAPLAPEATASGVIAPEPEPQPQPLAVEPVVPEAVAEAEQQPEPPQPQPVIPEPVDVEPVNVEPETPEHLPEQAVPVAHPEAPAPVFPEAAQPLLPPLPAHGEDLQPAAPFLAEQALAPASEPQPVLLAHPQADVQADAQAPLPAPEPFVPQPVLAEPTGPTGPQVLFMDTPPQGTPVPGAAEPAAVGQFVPVDGMVPTAPHLAPTPEQPIVLPGTAYEAPLAVPAPREGDPGLVQHADDLDTRAADQEDGEEGTAAVEGARRSTGPAAPAYDDAEREAVLKVMRERRDIRNGFRADPIPHEVLLRVLEAAHTAPSVGHSQPWDFVVIRSGETRRRMHELAERQRDAYAKSLPKGRAKQFKELKIEAILDTPVNIVVTADPTRGGRHTLGRHTQPQMAPYSAALAVENLWLAARAEGLGVGWVSFFDEREMVRALGLPEHLEVIAYLCVGYVDEFPDEPELMQAGWSKRRPLSWVVHEETYGRRALPGEEPHDLLAETVAQIRPLDAKALGEAWERQKRMTKPAGALGMLEIISAQLSGLSRQCPPPIPEPAAVAIFAGDHGVHAQGVTPWPQEVTAQMVANFLGGGAVCNAFAGQVGAEVCVIDVGVAADLPATPGLLPRKVRAGTSDMTTGAAMTREEAKQAIEVGIETARDLVAAGNKALLTGEMGIANTTASAALISVFTGADPSEVTGRGTGINDETLARKTEVVRRALEQHQPDPADPIGVLAAVGGFEHAALVGLLLGGASLRTPVILDGVSAGAAALVARAIAPEVLAACIAGHRSAEPGHVAALNKLGLRPLVDLDLRLGEGTGALLALPMVQSTARAMHEVATFDSAGVTEK